jgi:hypothetical protein
MKTVNRTATATMGVVVAWTLALVAVSRITWLGPERIKREWDVYQDGRKAGVMVFLLSRVP